MSDEAFEQGGDLLLRTARDESPVAGLAGAAGGTYRNQPQIRFLDHIITTDF
jgi:hypothetical protein